jgi:hippurate hydrolase
VHIANYRNGIDSLYAATLFINRAYEWDNGIQKEFPHLMRFGMFHSGTTNNVISDLSVIDGSVRSYADGTSDRVKDGLRQIAAELEQETGTTFEFFFADGYPPVVNDEAAYADAKEALTAAGFAWFEPTEPALYAEDFAFYLREVPGVYFHLGTGIDAKLHAVDYMIDEDVLLTGVKLFRTLVK